MRAALLQTTSSDDPEQNLASLRGMLLEAARQGAEIALSPEVIADTLGAILKYQDDIAKLQGSEAKRLLDEAKASLEPA